MQVRAWHRQGFSTIPSKHTSHLTSNPKPTTATPVPPAPPQVTEPIQCDKHSELQAGRMHRPGSASCTEEVWGFSFSPLSPLAGAALISTVLALGRLQNPAKYTLGNTSRSAQSSWLSCVCATGKLRQHGQDVPLTPLALRPFPSQGCASSVPAMGARSGCWLHHSISQGALAWAAQICLASQQNPAGSKNSPA